MHSKNLKVIVAVGLLVLCLSSETWSQNLMKLKAGRKQAGVKTEEKLALPEDLDAKNIDHIVAGLSDEQVRRLLIDELKAQAQREARAAAATAKPAGIAGIIDKIRNLTVLLQTRIEVLRSGGSTAPQEASEVVAFLARGERDTKSVTAVILSAGAVLAGAFLIEWLFVLYTAAARRRIGSTVPAGWSAKIGGLTLRALLELAAIVIFIISALVLFFLFLDRTAGQRVLLAGYVAAFVVVQVVFLLSRAFLSPRWPALRILPFSDETALYLHRWIMALTAVIAFGYVTSAVFRLAGANDLKYFQATVLVTLTIGVMLIWMILQKRQVVAAVFSRNLPESSLRCRLAHNWHYLAIVGVVLLLAFSIVNHILGVASGQGILTLLMVPLYFLLDWIMRFILEVAFGMVAPPEVRTLETAAASTGPQDGDVAVIARPSLRDTAEGKSVQGGGLQLDRMKGPLRTALRFALAALLFFWTLQIWGNSLEIGETVAKSAINILVVVLVCYIAWGIISAMIQRRMRREMPAEGLDDEQEEGGAGGSRIGTLLMLLRKFMLVVILVMAGLIILSALGVNVGPLIAGAGVIGLAIGFGAQTLVKDIISGMFFLIDDAFRVGDYVECGSAKGTVVQISLRALKLRHPRGQLYVLPFGDIKGVTNLSRDYVIMKLDFRVRYDVDVEKIRKVIKKKVYQPIMNDPELGPKLLEPIKSQGVREMDDSAMIMRVKYKTKPGDQFGIRREVYRLMQEAFKQEGIEFAHRNVTVYMPSEVHREASRGAAGADTQSAANTDGDIQRQAAAAALSAIEAEAQARLAQKQPKEK